MKIYPNNRQKSISTLKVGDKIRVKEDGFEFEYTHFNNKLVTISEIRFELYEINSWFFRIKELNNMFYIYIRFEVYED